MCVCLSFGCYFLVSRTRTAVAAGFGLVSARRERAPSPISGFAIVSGKCRPGSSAFHARSPAAIVPMAVLFATASSTSSLWKPRQRPLLRQVVKGDPGLSM